MLSYSINETLSMMGNCMGRTKLYQLINSGDLKAKKIGARTIILKCDLEDFLSNLKSYPSQNKEG